jgi:hypothetical protein
VKSGEQLRVSFLPQHGIHNPASFHMRPRLPAMIQEVVATVANILQGSRQDGQAVEGTFIVNLLGQVEYLGNEPGGSRCCDGSRTCDASWM